MRTSSIMLWIMLLMAPAASVAQDRQPVSEESQAPEEPLVQQHGDASYYSDKFAGQKTATGDTFSQNKLTAASRDLPLGTRVTVTNKENGKSVDVKVNDRGPYVDGRVIDLSKRAAERIGIKDEGVAAVKVEARPSSQASDDLKQAVKEKATQQNGE